MIDGKMLTEKTKEELIDQILGQYRKIGELEAKVRELEGQGGREKADREVRETERGEEAQKATWAEAWACGDDAGGSGSY